MTKNDQLVKDAAEGKSEAIQRLHEQYFGMITNKVYSYLSTTRDSAFEFSDFVSESLLAVWKTALNLNDGIQFSTLYYSIMLKYLLYRNRKSAIMCHSRGNKNSSGKPDFVYSSPEKSEQDYLSELTSVNLDELPILEEHSLFDELALEKLDPMLSGFVNLIKSGYSLQETNRILQITN